MKNIEATKTFETPVWGVPEVIAFTGLNRRAVYRLTDSGTFRSVDAGVGGPTRRRYVPAEVVRAWAEVCGIGQDEVRA